MTGDNEENRSNPSKLSQWLRAAGRSAVFLRPELGNLRASPTALVLLTVLVVGVGVLLQRLFVGGPAQFYAEAIASGWLTTVLLLWACWLVARSATNAAADAADTPTLFGVLLGQQLLISTPLWLLYLALPHIPGMGVAAVAAVRSVLPFVVVGWVALAGVVMLCRRVAPGLVRVWVTLAFVLGVAVDLYVPPTPYWYPSLDAALAQGEEEAEAKRLHVTQELLEQQSSVLVDSLRSLQPQRPGLSDLYVLTFAPYADEDVFRRESQMVADVMSARFDAHGHTLQLVNHADTPDVLPWATALNLRRAILRVASLMDPKEDILFIHLTSHGARDGKLAAEFFPLELQPLTPEQLRSWLDEAGVRLRVLSISACYSGSWVAPLSEPGTLVMTAADADHTSYGCGSKSELTFFGRAMYDEQMRRTRSFEKAHAEARVIIERREKEAGKDDGYSNPQIAVGELIRPHLQALAARLDARPATPSPVGR